MLISCRISARFAEFEETAPTFAENALGKALYYGRFADEVLMAEDSGLVVPALGGAPGVYSARYAGPEREPMPSAYGSYCARWRGRWETSAVRVSSA